MANTSPLSPADLDDVRDCLRETTGVLLTNEALQEILAERLTAEVAYAGTDTQVAEELADAFARTLLGRDWPTRGELTPHERPAFGASVAAARGWVLDRPPAPKP